MVNFNNNIESVKFIKPVTEGQPGNRVFSIEIFTNEINIKIIIEKEQLISISEYIIRNLYDKNLPISSFDFDSEQEFDQQFRSNDLTVEIQEQNKLFQLFFRNQEETEIINQLTIKITYEQAINFAKSGLNLSSKGRPLCKLCYRPMNQSDISTKNPKVCINCPRKNGHHKN